MITPKGFHNKAQRLSPKLARRVDAEDIVQSAYGSFFAGAREGRYCIERAGDLWRLLAAITVNKVSSIADLLTRAGRIEPF